MGWGGGAVQKCFTWNEMNQLRKQPLPYFFYKKTRVARIQPPQGVLTASLKQFVLSIFLN